MQGCRQGHGRPSSTARPAHRHRAARFNDASRVALAGLPRRAGGAGRGRGDVTHVTVPGALEIPVALKALAERDGFDALVALGCMIRGETYHFELVSNESGAGVSRVALDHQCRSPTRS